MKHNVENDESEQFTASETSANHKPGHTPKLSIDDLSALNFGSYQGEFTEVA